MTKAIALVVAASIGLAATGCTSGKKQAPQGTTPSSESVRAAPTGYHPVIDPANFQGLVDNPWFPLKPGSTAVYRGSKDGEPVREVYEVTHGVQKIMGVPCVVVHDQLFHSDGSLAEDTFDFYTQDRQGNDVGTQYRSAIFYHNPEQKTIAEKVIADLTRQGIWGRPIVTEVAPLGTFYPAEEYHQGYFRANPSQGYCQAVVAPKVAKFRKHFADRIRAAE